MARSQAIGLGISDTLTCSHQSDISDFESGANNPVARPAEIQRPPPLPIPTPRLITWLTVIAVGLILIGFLSPWVPHSTAGLALTGFELGEWIKFVPEMRSENPPLRRTDFYWPPVAAAAGLVVLATESPRWGLRNWLLLLLATVLSLFPFPLLEELRGLGGVSASTGRLVLTGFGLVLAVLALWRRKLTAQVRGAILIIPAGLGLVLTSIAFAAAEPIVERLYNNLIDPGPAFNLTRGGMLVLIFAGIMLLLRRPATGATSD